MAENSLYFEAIVGQRALTLDPEEAIRGDVTVSLETVEEFAKDDILSGILENFAAFITAIKHLSKPDKEMLLSYYLLSKTQAQIGALHGITQTVCSSLIRVAAKRLGAFLTFGKPTVEVLSKIFRKAKLEDSLGGVPLSRAVLLYEETKSFEHVANTLHVRRADVRRAMNRATDKLLQSENDEAQMIGSWLHGLTEKASTYGQGYSKREEAKFAHIYCRDSEIFGAFRIDIKHPDVDKLFTSKANRLARVS